MLRHQVSALQIDLCPKRELTLQFTTSQRAKSVEASKFPDELRPRPRMMSEGDDAAAESAAVVKPEKPRSKSVTSEGQLQRPLSVKCEAGDEAPRSGQDTAVDAAVEARVNGGGLSAPSLVRSLASSSPSSASPSEPPKVWKITSAYVEFLMACFGD